MDEHCFPLITPPPSAEGTDADSAPPVVAPTSPKSPKSKDKKKAKAEKLDAKK